MKLKTFKISLLAIFFAIFASFIYLLALKLEPTKIIEITNSTCSYNELYRTEVYHFFMIINPPKNPTELKDLMLDYCKKTKVPSKN